MWQLRMSPPTKKSSRAASPKKRSRPAARQRDHKAFNLYLKKGTALSIYPSTVKMTFRVPCLRASNLLRAIALSTLSTISGEWDALLLTSVPKGFNRFHFFSWRWVALKASMASLLKTYSDQLMIGCEIWFLCAHRERNSQIKALTLVLNVPQESSP